MSRVIPVDVSRKGESKNVKSGREQATWIVERSVINIWFGVEYSRPLLYKECGVSTKDRVIGAVCISYRFLKHVGRALNLLSQLMIRSLLIP